MKRALWVLLLAAACSNENQFGPGNGNLAPPTGLFYSVTSGGPDAAPAATLLEWDVPDDPNVNAWNIYSRTGTSGSFGLRATTTSNTFHDRGVPEAQYYVTAVDVNGFESAPSQTVTIDERLTLDAPADLGTTSLDGAVALFWEDNAFEQDPEGFQTYRVYSASYDLDNDRCGDWALEGTTVAPEFVAGALQNGVPRCFGVTAVTIEGFESLWSPIRDDTPRPESRNVVVFTAQQDPARAGFRFWRDANGNGAAERGELGLVQGAAVTDVDFVVERGVGETVTLRPVRTGTTARPYTDAPIGDLTSIDIAPVNGYGTGTLTLQPGWGYVFQMSGLAGDGFLRFGAVRLQHVGTTFVILDWSFQTDRGNPQLLRQ
jgi:hypothetical protein